MYRALFILSLLFLVWPGAIALGQIDFLAERILPGLGGNELLPLADSSTLGSRQLVNVAEYRMYYKQWTGKRVDYDFSHFEFASFSVLPELTPRLSMVSGWKMEISRNYIRQSENRSGNLSYDRKALFLQMKLGLPWRHISLSAYLSGSSLSYPLNYEIGIETEIIPSFFLLAGLKKESYEIPLAINYNLDEISALFPVNQNRYYAGLRSDLGSRASNYFIVSQNISYDGFNRSVPKYEIAPDASSSCYHNNFRFNIFPSATIIFDGEKTLHRQSADLYRYSESFGHFGNIRYNIDSYRLILDYQIDGRRNIACSYYESLVNINIGGHIDSWPFTDFLTQIMGPRMYVRARGELSNKGTQIDFTSHSTKGKSYSLQLGFFHFEPDGFITTWNPAVIGFGVANKKIYANDIDWIDVLKIGGSFENHYRRLSIKYSICQYIPLRIERIEAAQDAGGGENNGGDGKVITLGGSFHKLVVGWEF